MLLIRQDLVAAMVAHARRDHPDEACGVLAGPAGSDRPERIIEMLNSARSMTFYEFDSDDLIRLHRELESRDEEWVVFYHSHTVTEAVPSRRDVDIAGYPEAHYVLISTRDPDVIDLRSYRIIDGVATEEPFDVVESYMFSHTGADDVPDAP